MTLEQRMEKVTREIDALYVQRMDANLLRMVEAGVDTDDAADLVEHQRETYLVWRVKTLADLRIKLEAAVLEP